MPFRSMKLLLAVFFWIGVSMPASAQWVTHPPPANSPYWWTLTPEMSPAQLRPALIPRPAHQDRFVEAAEARGEAPSGEEVRRVEYFISGRHTPELFPMFAAYTSLAFKADRTEGAEEVRQLLSLYGFSDARASLVLDSLKDFMEARNRAVLSLADERSDVVEALDRAKEPTVKALREGNVDRVAMASGMSRERAQGMLKAWTTFPAVDTALVAIVDLKARLESDEWADLRRLLLEEVAHGLHLVELEDRN